MNGRPKDFGDPIAELEAAFDTCAMIDRSDLARLSAAGSDGLDLLHRLSTADLRSLGPGSGRPTVLTTSKGRILERLFVHHLTQDDLLLVGGRGSSEKVASHLARHTFAENVRFADVTAQTCQLVLIGPRARDVVQAAGLEAPGAHGAKPGKLGGEDVHVLGEDGSSGTGLSVVGPAGAARASWLALLGPLEQAGGRPAGELALEAWRVLGGLPADGHELTEDYNPLEAGLWEAVSFDKGCYVGQEVVARLRTYDKVARSFVGLELPPVDAPPPGTGLFLDGREVGSLTSVARLPDGSRTVGLGYVKRKEVHPGLALALGPGPAAPAARLVPLPFDRPVRR